MIRRPFDIQLNVVVFVFTAAAATGEVSRVRKSGKIERQHYEVGGSAGSDSLSKSHQVWDPLLARCLIAHCRHFDRHIVWTAMTGDGQHILF